MTESDAGKALLGQRAADGEDGVAAVESGERVLVLAIGPGAMQHLFAA